MNSAIKQTTDAALPYVIGAIGGILTLFASGFFKSFFDESARQATHKREVARHILKICIEASTNSFISKPRDMEDIYSALTDLEGLDKQIMKHMENFVTSWQFISVKNNNTRLKNADDKKFFQEHYSGIEKERKILVKWANEIRVGHTILFKIKKFLAAIKLRVKKINV